MSLPFRIALLDPCYRQRAKFCHALQGATLHVNPVDSVAEFYDYGARAQSLLVPDRDAIFEDVMAALAGRSLSIPIIVFGDALDFGRAMAVMNKGADHYLNINLPRVEIVDQLARAISKHNQKGSAACVDHTSALTVREADILNFVTKGFTSKAIGRQLCISHRTVDAHRAKILRKLKLPRIAHLALVAQ